MKKLLKQSVQGAVAAVAPALWRIRGASLLVLMYHRVLPPGDPACLTEQPGMFVSPGTLALHLAVLQEHFQFMHLDDWLRRTAAGQPVPPRACAITFDDGWRDNFEHAYPVLRKAQAPATIYLVADLVGTQYSFWPNNLARMLADPAGAERARLPVWLRELVAAQTTDAAPLAAAQIDAIINACKATRSDAEMLAVTAAEASGRDLMSWEEIETLRAGGLVRFGSHTRRHTRLSQVTDRATLEDEILGSRRLLQERLGSAPETFCFPNGDTSPAAVDCVRTAYLGAVTTEAGWNARTADPYLLRRIGVHEDVSASRSALLARLCGVG